jgi:hypothetical protein
MQPMFLVAEIKKIARFGALGAIGCLAGWLIGEPLLALGLPEATSNAAPSLVSHSAAPPPPPEFKERLENHGAHTGDVQISLIWDNRHDLDLHCIDPLNEDIYYGNKHSRSGGWLDVDSNAGCERDIRDKAVENIYWETGKAPDGLYQVFVHFFLSCPREPRTDPNRKDFETPFRVRILTDGEEKVLNGTVKYSLDQRDRLVRVHEFRIGPKLKIETPKEATIRVGTPLELPFRLIRLRTPGPATVTATNLPSGVKATTVLVPAGETNGTITLTTSGATAGTGGIELSVTADSQTGTAPLSLTVIEGATWSWRLILVLGAWTALLASGLTAALVAGQNRYLGRPWNAGGLPLAAAGAAGAGALSGAVGQALLFVFAFVSLGGLGFFAGWLLLGALLGMGVSYFIPNLDRKKATFAGLAGGGLAALAFLIASLVADWLGRVVGSAILGLLIGLMVALVEVAFRRAWLEVQLGGGEKITVNLGPEPVKVGDDRGCTIWARGAAAVALRYWLRDGRVVCHDLSAGGEQPVGDGDRRQAGPVTVIVRTGAGIHSPFIPPVVNLPPRATPPKPVIPPAPPVSIPSAATEVKQPVPPPISPRPLVPPPPPKPIAQPAAPGGGPLPKPIIPPPAPPTPAGLSVTSLGGVPAVSKPPAPVVNKPPAPVVSKPPAPVVSKPPAPVVSKPPAPVVSKPPAPVVSKPPPIPPKPPAPAKPAGSPANTGDRCPTPGCGRTASGLPGKRYCMVCDHYF